ncbi:cell wall anchor protein [Streptococcus iniae]|uniref:C39 family peptidase n=1 Tax=Streptococcus iniae TaxID=1346 RepID=UPI00030229D9|nr:C39 family peptidase [Streptococcus iniae]ESR08901.1 gram positive anchor [Streptococcus iniae IUSA1]OHX27210.1 cell wall anchor protein [Streptococcus iniae]RLV27675.1 cell wall anchor protein [Streptococcus iniae]
MKQSKVLAGLVVASVSTGAGVVHAEDAVVETQPKVTTSEVTKAPEVTETEVKEAKATLDQASSAVKSQEGVVAEATTAKDQAQTSVVNETTKVAEAEKVAKEATPEAITEATEAVEEAKQSVTESETSLKDVQTFETKASQDVQAQTKTVDANAKTVTTKQSEVAQAQSVVNTAQKAIDSTTANTDLVVAEKAVAEKTTEVKTAETNLETAKQADQKLIKDIANADAILQSKTSTLVEKQDVLNTIVNAIKANQVNVAPDAVTYFNQNDPAWGWKYYGGWTMGVAGCAPTSMAMVFTELLGRQVLPTEVADYLYNQTNLFNKTVIGTKGQGVISASQHYGLVANSLGSQSDVVKALQDGHFVLGAVGNNKFTPYGGTHELVLKGYSNGSTFAYDPYTHSNIGWYPVANLWSEQSQDPDDRYGLLSPFVKITTQKMAELEAQKAQAQSTVNVANNQLAQAKQALTNLQATAPKAPEAKAKLATAKVELATAQDNYVKAQEAVKFASQELAVKEAILKNAKADLLTKQAALTDAQKTLGESQAKLAILQSNLTIAQAKVKEAQLALTQSEATVNQKEAQLLSLQNVPKVLSDAQVRLAQAKAVLANKVTVLNQAIVKLKELQANKADAEAQYTTVFEVYKAVLDAKKQAELMELYAKIIAGGGEAIPVIDETGKITGYVDGTQKPEVKPTAVVLSNSIQNKVVTDKSVEATLPHAGEQGSLLVMLGIGILSLLGLLNFKNEEK